MARKCPDCLTNNVTTWTYTNRFGTEVFVIKCLECNRMFEYP